MKMLILIELKFMLLRKNLSLLAVECWQSHFNS